MHSPARIALSRSRGLTIHWQDGHQSHYSARYLRDHCPCALCATRKPSPFALFDPTLQALSIEPVGAYAVQIHFSDQHRSGIFSFDRLRALCPCGECAPA